MLLTFALIFFPFNFHLYPNSIISRNWETEALNMIKAMKSITQLDEITSCQLNSNYNDTNKETKEYRYGALFDLTHY